MDIGITTLSLIDTLSIILSTLSTDLDTTEIKKCFELFRLPKNQIIEKYIVLKMICTKCKKDVDQKLFYSRVNKKIKTTKTCGNCRLKQNIYNNKKRTFYEEWKNISPSDIF